MAGPTLADWFHRFVVRSGMRIERVKGAAGEEARLIVGAYTDGRKASTTRAQRLAGLVGLWIFALVMLLVSLLALTLIVFDWQRQGVGDVLFNLGLAAPGIILTAMAARLTWRYWLDGKAGR